MLEHLSADIYIYTTIFTMTGREKQKHKKQTNNKRMTKNQLN